MHFGDHLKLAPHDIHDHLRERHAGHDVAAMAAQVTDQDLEMFREGTDADTDEIDRARIVHDRLHDQS